jgi:tetratricopeptide (TPR) repeat protein
LEIDPRSSDAHAALAHIDLHLGKFTEAEEHLHAALEINPNHAEAHLWQGLFLRMVRRDLRGAVEEINRALQLDPLERQSYRVASIVFLYCGEYQRAIETARRGFELTREKAFQFVIARAYALEGRFAEAETALDKVAPAGSPDTDRALILALQGRREETLAMLRRMEQDSVPASPQLIAFAYAAAGDVRDATRNLQPFVAKHPELRAHGSGYAATSRLCGIAEGSCLDRAASQTRPAVASRRVPSPRSRGEVARSGG